MYRIFAEALQNGGLSIASNINPKELAVPVESKDKAATNFGEELLKSASNVMMESPAQQSLGNTTTENIKSQIQEQTTPMPLPTIFDPQPKEELDFSKPIWETETQPIVQPVIEPTTSIVTEPENSTVKEETIPVEDLSNREFQIRTNRDMIAITETFLNTLKEYDAQLTKETDNKKITM